MRAGGLIRLRLTTFAQRWVGSDDLQASRVPDIGWARFRKGMKQRPTAPAGDHLASQEPSAGMLRSYGRAHVAATGATASGVCGINSAPFQSHLPSGDSCPACWATTLR